MSIALERFCFIFQLIRPSHVDLYIKICVAGCGFSIYHNMVLTNMASLASIKRDSHYASEADSTTF